MVWYVDGYRGFDEVIERAKIPKNRPRATVVIKLCAFRGGFMMGVFWRGQKLKSVLLSRSCYGILRRVRVFWEIFGKS